ncbi:hypothetical protein M138_4656 [Bacteroides fragilis str. S23L17]|nr:hypothetical protein M138_4656 [Bacteroides fragilis str. S23L17]
MIFCIANIRKVPFATNSQQYFFIVFQRDKAVTVSFFCAFPLLLSV